MFYIHTYMSNLAQFKCDPKIYCDLPLTTFHIFSEVRIPLEWEGLLITVGGCVKGKFLATHRSHFHSDILRLEVKGPF